MKKTAKKQSKDVRDEYRFDYSKSKPNRFAAQIQEGSVAVLLEPDVASVFNSSETVNQLLRSVITALPKNARAKKPSRRTVR
jgi:hypothetical protein